MEKENTVRCCLLDAGCSEKDVKLVEELCRKKKLPEALREIRVIRSGLMDELHQSQRKVDCIDYLIRQTEKEIKEERR